MTLSDNMRGALYMTIAMAAFVFNDACMKYVTQDMPLFQAIALRGVLCSAALAVIAWWQGALRLPADPADRRILFWRTFGEVMGTITFLTALQQMVFANISALMQALPLTVALAAALFLREPLGWRRLLAIFIGFLGVLLIVRPGTDGFDIWSLVVLASVGFVTLRDLTTRRLGRSVPSVTVALVAAVAVTLMGGVALPFVGWAPILPGQWLLIGSAATFLIGGYLFAVMVMRVGDIGFVAPFRYTALVFAIVLGWLVFAQWPDGVTLLGAALIIATGLFTFWRERQLGRRWAATGKA